MYYTDKPNVIPQEKLEIPYNILFMLKASIFTLFKANIEIFVWYNCRKKRIIQTNYPFFGWIQYILSATRTFKPSIIISFCWKLAKTFKRFQKVLSQVDFPSIKHSILRLPRRLSSNILNPLTSLDFFNFYDSLFYWNNCVSRICHGITQHLICDILRAV